jgi:hypothetical protein
VHHLDTRQIQLIVAHTADRDVLFAEPGDLALDELLVLGVDRG